MASPVVQIEGIRETLAELNKIDNRYRRQVTKRIKNAGERMINDGRQLISSYERGQGAPLSGMRRGSLIRGRAIMWDATAAKKGLKVKVGVRATRERYVTFNRSDEYGNQYTEQVPFGAKPYRLMVIQQADPAGAIFDHAGRRTRSGFVSSLDTYTASYPRVVIPAVERNRPAVIADVQAVLKDVEQVTNRNLRVRRGN